MSYRFVGSFRTGPGLNSSSILVLLESCLQTCMTNTVAECTVNKLLMMDRENFRNMLSFMTKYICVISASSWFYYKETLLQSLVHIPTVSIKINRCVLFKGFAHEEKRPLNLTKELFKKLHLSKDHSIRSIVHKTNKLHLLSKPFLCGYHFKIKQYLVGKKYKPEMIHKLITHGEKNN